MRGIFNLARFLPKETQQMNHEMNELEFIVAMFVVFLKYFPWFLILSSIGCGLWLIVYVLNSSIK